MHTKTDLLSVDESLRQVLINNHILSSVGAMHLNYKIYYFSRSFCLSLFFFLPCHQLSNWCAHVKRNRGNAVVVFHGGVELLNELKVSIVDVFV